MDNALHTPHRIVSTSKCDWPGGAGTRVSFLTVRSDLVDAARGEDHLIDGLDAARRAGRLFDQRWSGRSTARGPPWTPSTSKRPKPTCRNWSNARRAAKRSSLPRRDDLSRGGCRWPGASRHARSACWRARWKSERILTIRFRMACGLRSTGGRAEPAARQACFHLGGGCAGSARCADAGGVGGA